MIAMYLSRQLTGASFPEIGLRFGGKDHSTVINACKRIESIQSDDRELRATVDTLRRQLTSRDMARDVGRESSEAGAVATM